MIGEGNHAVDCDLCPKNKCVSVENKQSCADILFNTFVNLSLGEKNSIIDSG